MHKLIAIVSFILAIAIILALISHFFPEVSAVAKSNSAQPNVTMAADPPPPFTYWAPKNSTIRNHPHQPGIWLAESKDGPRKYYFGDQCKASDFQRLIGQKLEALPEKPTNAVWRLVCSTCVGTSDLIWTRLNISYEQETRAIKDISCG